MRAKYASAIRSGIENARAVRYGENPTGLYQKRSDTIWGNFHFGGGSSEWEYAIRAFDRENERRVKAHTKNMSIGEYQSFWLRLERERKIFWEDPEEREVRLLREEVSKLRGAVCGLRG